MDDEFRKFGDAACLYAKYAAVVDEMWEIFLGELSSFFDAVRERVRSKLTSGSLQEEASPSGRSWWIDDEVTKFDDVPFVWMDSRKPQTVDPGELEVEVGLNTSDESHRQHIAVVESALRLPAHCKLVKKGRLFWLTISYGKDDPVTLAADPIHAVLEALFQAERNWRLAHPPTKRKGR